MWIRDINGKLVEINTENLKNDLLFYQKILELRFNKKFPKQTNAVSDIAKWINKN
jgi:hypothetical protein